MNVECFFLVFRIIFFWEMRQHSINIWGICARRVIRIIHIWAIPFFCLRFLSWTATMMTHDDLFMFQLRCGVGIQHCECSGCIDYRKVMRQKRVHQSAAAKMVLFWWKRWVLREQETYVFWGKDLESSKKNNQIIWNTRVFLWCLLVSDRSIQLSKKQRPIWRKISTKNLSHCTRRFLGLQSLKARRGTSGTSRRRQYFWPGWPSLYAKDSPPVMSGTFYGNLFFILQKCQKPNSSLFLQELFFFFDFLKLMSFCWFLLRTISEHLSQPFGGWVLGKVHWCYEIHNAPSMKGLRVQIKCSSKWSSGLAGGSIDTRRGLWWQDLDSRNYQSQIQFEGQSAWTQKALAISNREPKRTNSATSRELSTRLSIGLFWWCQFLPILNTYWAILGLHRTFKVMEFKVHISIQDNFPLKIKMIPFQPSLGVYHQTTPFPQTNTVFYLDPPNLHEEIAPSPPEKTTKTALPGNELTTSPYPPIQSPPLHSLSRWGRANAKFSKVPMWKWPIWGSFPEEVRLLLWKDFIFEVDGKEILYIIYVVFIWTYVWYVCI